MHGTSPAFQWLRLRTSNAGGTDSIPVPAGGTDTPLVAGKKKKKENIYVLVFALFISYFMSGGFCLIGFSALYRATCVLGHSVMSESFRPHGL